MSDGFTYVTVLLSIYCALVLASLAGGWLLLATRLTHARMQSAVSLVAGLMLGVALLHFIPDSAEHSHSLDQTVHWVLGGFLSMFFLQRFFPHHHHDVPEGAPEQHGRGPEPPHSPQVNDQQAAPVRTLAEHSASQLSWAATTVGMAFHSLLGGVALGAAVATGTGAGGRLVQCNMLHFVC